MAKNDPAFDLPDTDIICAGISEAMIPNLTKNIKSTVIGCNLGSKPQNVPSGQQHILCFTGKYLWRSKLRIFNESINLGRRNINLSQLNN